MKKIKCILFDFGSTLALCEFNQDTLNIANKKVYNYLKKRSYKLSFEELCKRRKITFKKYEEQSNKKLITPQTAKTFKKYMFYDIKISKKDLNQIIKIYSKYDHKTSFREELKEVLLKLKKRGIRIGLVTNSWLVFPREELKKANLLKYFNVVIISSEVGFKKPHPNIFKKAMKKLKVSPKECVFVGDDSIQDISGAKNVGIRYTIGIVPFSRLDNSEPDFIIKNLNEIFTLNLF